jgi:glucose-1-phosphate cytidylyltransferase
MKAVILCGGRGTRIRDVSELIPKPMLPIGGHPILWHIMKSYAAHGINEFVLCLGYKGWAIKEYFLNYRTMMSDITVRLAESERITYHSEENDDWSVTLVDTGEHTMTGGRLLAVKKYLDQETFCLTYGDGVADINIARLVEQHRSSGLVATLSSVQTLGRFGDLEIESGKVTRFQEKPLDNAPRINGGFMVFDGKRIWNYLDDRPDLILEREPLESLASSGQLGTYNHDGFWQCMDTLREYDQLNAQWSSGRAKWKVW